MSFPKYEAYKDSGVEWLGEVPDHWELKQAKYVFVLQRGHDLSSDQMKEGKYPVFGSNGIIGFHNKCTTLAPNVTVGRSGSVGLINYVNDDFWAHNTALFVKNFWSYHPRFTFYLLVAINPSRLAAGSAVGTLDRNNIHSQIVAAPPYLEATHIACFLDYETARIDALIAEQQRLIELLKEKRQAVISHAVTKGLDPTAPMKDSGVEWLGEVPANWKITKLKHAVFQCGGGTPSKENINYWDGDIPWVTPKDMKREFIGDSIDHISEIAIRETNLTILQKQVVLIVVRGMILAHSVPVAITTAPTTINQDMKAMIAKEVIDPDYLLMLLQGMKDAIFSFIDNSAHGTKKIEWERFENVSIPLPGRIDQKRIVDELRKRLFEIDELAAEVSEVLAILDERRSALISAAVTGKIDVRGWQAPVSAAPALEPVHG